MCQRRDESESMSSRLGEERDLSASIGASEEDGFISGAKPQRPIQACSNQCFMLWLRYLLLFAAWIISIMIAFYVLGKSHNLEGLSNVTPTELSI
jgi:hypothetical protein